MNRERLSNRRVNRKLRIGQNGRRSVVLHKVMRGSTPIAKVRTYLDTLGLTWSELFDEPPPDTATRPEPRLRPDRHHERAGIDLDHLCVIFGVTLYELRDDSKRSSHRWKLSGSSHARATNNAGLRLSA